MSASLDPHATLAQAHALLSPDVRDTQWQSNCAGEVFAMQSDEQGPRIGHFQGDAKLAAFAVAAHVLGQRGGLVLREGGQVATPKTVRTDKVHGAWMKAHKALSPDLQKAKWVAGSDGEVFAKKRPETLRIGYFQGDILLASFVTQAHASAISLSS